MARTRSLKPDFFEDTTLANCEPLARYLYAGLWCWLDGQCVIEADPRIHKKNIFPYDESVTLNQVSTWIEQLVQERRLIRFAHNGKDLLFCPRLAKHSRVYEDEPKKFEVPEDIIAALCTSAGETRRSAYDLRGQPADAAEAEAEAKRKLKKKAEPQKFELEQIYAEFPQCSGTRKGEGMSSLAIQSRDWSEQDFEDCIRAAKNYRMRCEYGDGKSPTPEAFIQQFKTWAGSAKDPKWREWINWQPPVVQTAQQIDWDSEAQAFLTAARKYGRDDGMAAREWLGDIRCVWLDLIGGMGRVRETPVGDFGRKSLAKALKTAHETQSKVPIQQRNTMEDA